MDIKLTIDATVGNEVDGMLLQKTLEEFLGEHFSDVPMEFKLAVRKSKAAPKETKAKSSKK